MWRTSAAGYNEIAYDIRRKNKPVSASAGTGFGLSETPQAPPVFTQTHR